MLKISEILELDSLSELRQLNPEIELNHLVDGVGILDHETEDTIPLSFKKYDFVMTTLSFAKEDSSLIERNFRALMKIGASGIVIKDVFCQGISPEVRSLAAEYQVPLFLFSDPMRTEDIISIVREALEIQENDLLLEEWIDRAVRAGAAPEVIRSAAQRVNPLFESWLTAAYCLPKEKENCKMMEITARLARRRRFGQLPRSCAALRYKKGILLFYSFSGEGEWTKAEEKNLLQFAEGLGICMDAFWIGISGTADSYGEFHQSVRQSILTARACRVEHRNPWQFEELGIYQILLTMAENDYIREHCRTVQKCLLESDERLHSNLFATAAAYVENNGDIGKTATALYQHPNTIRYRLQKIRRLIEGTEETKQNFYEHLYLVIRLLSLQEDD